MCALRAECGGHAGALVVCRDTLFPGAIRSVSPRMLRDEQAQVVPAHAARTTTLAPQTWDRHSPSVLMTTRVYDPLHVFACSTDAKTRGPQPNGTANMLACTTGFTTNSSPIRNSCHHCSSQTTLTADTVDSAITVGYTGLIYKPRERDPTPLLQQSERRSPSSSRANAGALLMAV